MEISEKDTAMIELVNRLGDGMRCETCRFFSPIQSVSYGDGKGSDGKSWDKFGKCHRYPPHNKNNATAARAYFPTVAHDDWCGEHIERGT